MVSFVWVIVAVLVGAIVGVIAGALNGTAAMTDLRISEANLKAKLEAAQARLQAWENSVLHKGQNTVAAPSAPVISTDTAVPPADPGAIPGDTGAAK